MKPGETYELTNLPNGHKRGRCPACGTSDLHAQKAAYVCGFSSLASGNTYEVLTICTKAEIGDYLMKSKTETKTDTKPERHKCTCDSKVLFGQGCKCGGY